MTEHIEQTAAQPEAVPARIQLDDFIEAVTRGVARALAAQDEVSGYAAQYGGDGITRYIRDSSTTIGLILQFPPPYQPPTSSGQTAGTPR